MLSQTGKKSILIHILPNISWSKRNQTTKFCQLIEYNPGNIFLKKSYTQCGGQVSPRPFIKKIKIEHICGSTVKNDIQFVFIVCSSGSLPKDIKTEVLITCFDLVWSFLKNKKRSRTSHLSLIFCMIFEGRYISRYIQLKGDKGDILKNGLIAKF